MNQTVNSSMNAPIFTHKKITLARLTCLCFDLYRPGTVHFHAVSKNKHFLISRGLVRVYFNHEPTPRSVFWQKGFFFFLICGGVGDMKFAHERA